MARGITYFVHDLCMYQLGFADRYENLFSMIGFSLLTPLILQPFYAVQALRMSDIGRPLSSVIANKKEEGKTPDLEEVSPGTVQKYDGIWDIVSSIWQEDGIMGFYRGYLPAALKLIASDIHWVAWYAIAEMTGGESVFMNLGFMFQQN
eukprot:UN26576